MKKKKALPRARNQFVVDLGAGEAGRDRKAAIAAAAEQAGVSASEWVRQAVVVALGLDPVEKRIAELDARIERLGGTVQEVQRLLGVPGP